MKVAVAGLWHLGAVTAACLAAAGHDVVGFDHDAAVVGRLAEGRAPLFEPGLDDLLAEGLQARRLRFTTDPGLLAAADVVWITYDTPVDDHDRADVEAVVAHVQSLFPFVQDGALVVVSSQVPVGTTARLERGFADVADGRAVEFAYSPENLRLGQAIERFTRPDRVVVGVRGPRARDVASALLAPITDRVEWMSVESAEMTKHALNAFLATSVTFINEIAALCEQTGADAADVARGLKSESRIGPRAYLGPGAAFAGGTLARDLTFLSALGRAHGRTTPLLDAVTTSNDAHRAWAQERLSALLGRIEDARVGIWGLTYTPGTDTLRRSSAIELCTWLAGRGAHVQAHDPAVRTLPAGLEASIDLKATAIDAVRDTAALVVCTAWPEYRQVSALDVIAGMSRPLILDANRALADTLAVPGVEYISVGRAVA